MWAWGVAALFSRWMFPGGWWEWWLRRVGLGGGNGNSSYMGVDGGSVSVTVQVESLVVWYQLTTKVILRELPAVTRVSENRAERVTGQWVVVLERVGCGIANGGQKLEKCGIFPVREGDVKLDPHMVERHECVERERETSETREDLPRSSSTTSRFRKGLKGLKELC
jgi:hypothetical protein